MKVEIYSDIACPWCYIGERRFSRALTAFPQAEQVEVVFRPFQLDPTLPQTASPLKERLKDKFGDRLDATLQHTALAAEQENLDFNFDAAQAVNTLTAHRLLRLAEHAYGAEVQRALADKLFEAYFTKGENIADPDVLTGLAVAAGMEKARAAAYLASDEGLEEVGREIAQAQLLGIRAVPTFVFDGRFAVQGAQPADTFLDVLQEVQKQATPSAESATAEACDDESCAIPTAS